MITDSQILRYIERHPRFPLSHVAQHLGLTFHYVEDVHNRDRKKKQGKKKYANTQGPDPSEEELERIKRAIKRSLKCLLRKGGRGREGNAPRIREYVTSGQKMVYQQRG